MQHARGTLSTPKKVLKVYKHTVCLIVIHFFFVAICVNAVSFSISFESKLLIITLLSSSLSASSYSASSSSPSKISTTMMPPMKSWKQTRFFFSWSRTISLQTELIFMLSPVIISTADPQFIPAGIFPVCKSLFRAAVNFVGCSVSSYKRRASLRLLYSPCLVCCLYLYQHKFLLA